MAKKGKKPRRRKASSRSGKPKRKVDRKLQSSQSLNPTSRLSGGPGSVGPWPMNPYGVSFGGVEHGRTKTARSIETEGSELRDDVS